MPAPSVWFRVLAKGYRVRAGQDGLHATVPCLVDWSNTFSFVDDVLGFPKGVKGSIVYQVPWKFPGAPNARMYAMSCDVEPIGAGGAPLPPTYGLLPGEFFKYAIVTVEFQNRSFLQQPSDDPGNQNQLDPASPIAFCEMSVRGGAKMVTRKGVGYQYAGGAPLVGDIGVVEPECKLTLKYPWIPFQPWQAIQSLVGSVNSVAMLGCAAGTLLFEEFDTKATATTQGLMGQEVTYSLAWQATDWNKIPNASGTPTAVTRRDGSGLGIYPAADLRTLFL